MIQICLGKNPERHLPKLYSKLLGLKLSDAVFFFPCANPNFGGWKTETNWGEFLAQASLGSNECEIWRKNQLLRVLQEQDIAGDDSCEVKLYVIQSPQLLTSECLRRGDTGIAFPYRCLHFPQETTQRRQRATPVLTSVLACFSTPPSSSPTPVGCSTIQLNPDTI